MPLNYNTRHDLQQEERIREEARINERVTRLANPQNIQQQTSRRHPDNIRDSRLSIDTRSRGGKRAKRRNRTHKRKYNRTSYKKNLFSK